MADKFCTNCGQAIPDGAQNCPSCGMPVTGPEQPTYQAPVQNAPEQPSYQVPPPVPPVYQNPAYYGVDTSPLSIKSYIFMFIISAIPMVGFIMLFVWAFGNYSINKKNYARAVLILDLIAVVLCILIGILLVAAGISIANVPQGRFY